MAKVVLINPPNVKPMKGYISYEAVPSLGLAYIAGSVASGGHSVTVIDAVGSALDEYNYFDADFILQGLTFSEISKRIPAGTDVLGVSINFSISWFVVKEMLRVLKMDHPDTRIILGGEHVTGDWYCVLETSQEADFCVLGEGEETILELLNNLENPFSVKGIAYRQNGVPVKNERRSRISDVNNIPRPLWEAFPLREYLDRGYSMTGFGKRSIPILSSRGCPFRCTFCSSPNMWGTDLSLRDPADVIGEVKKYVRMYGINQVELFDLVGVINKTWTNSLLDLLIAEELDLEWVIPAGTRSELLNPDMLKKFKESKVARIIVAPETGSKKMVKEIQKHANLDKIHGSVKTASELSIPTRASIIIGFPGQTVRDYLETFIYTIKLTLAGVNDVSVNVYLAYPGTELYQKLINEEKIPSVQKSPEAYEKYLKMLMCSQLKGQMSHSVHMPPWLMHTLQFFTLFCNYSLQFLIRPQRISDMLYRVFILRRPITIPETAIYKIFFKRRKITSAYSVGMTRELIR